VVVFVAASVVEGLSSTEGILILSIETSDSGFCTGGILTLSRLTSESNLTLGSVLVPVVDTSEFM
jgi:hypothetical protein